MSEPDPHWGQHHAAFMPSAYSHQAEVAAAASEEGPQHAHTAAGIQEGGKGCRAQPPLPGVTVPRPHSDHSCVSWRSPLDTDLVCVQCSWGETFLPISRQDYPRGF